MPMWILNSNQPRTMDHGQRNFFQRKVFREKKTRKSSCVRYLLFLSLTCVRVCVYIYFSIYKKISFSSFNLLSFSFEKFCSSFFSNSFPTVVVWLNSRLYFSVRLFRLANNFDVHCSFTHQFTRTKMKQQPDEWTDPISDSMIC